MTSEPIRWWEIRDDGSWPGYWSRPPLYMSGPGYNQPVKQHDPRTSDWRLRPHP